MEPWVVSTGLIFVYLLATIVLGIVATEEFKGALHYRCARPGFNETPGHPNLIGALAATSSYATATSSLTAERS